MALDKLVDSTQLDGALTATANAIRAKGGTSASIAWDETNGFKSAIEDLPTGGGSAVVVTEEPDTNGGTKKIITAVELTGDTVTAEHLEVGYTAHNASGQAITGTMPASSGSVGRSDVNFYDYDGTLVASKTKTEINAMTSDSDLPANPTHTGLTAQGWNWTVTQLKAQLTAMPDQPVDVGQMYVTSSGDTEIDVVMVEGRLNPTLAIGVNGTVSVDWGDNTTAETLTGTSLTTQKKARHTYASAGEYTIKISVTSGKFQFYASGNASLTFRKQDDGYSDSRVYLSCVKYIRIGNGITSIGDYAFYGFHDLKSITIPSSITSIGGNVFYACYMLNSVTIPKGITGTGANINYSAYNLKHFIMPSSLTSIGDYAFYYCHALENITIPSGVTSIGTYTFQYEYAIKRIDLPNGITSIGKQCFQYAYNLKHIVIPTSVTSIGENAFLNACSLAKVTIPSSVTSISAKAFNGCIGLAEIHFQRTTPPTLANTNAFAGLSADCVFYVPYSADHSVLTAYQTASIWSNYASYMQEEPAP